MAAYGATNLTVETRSPPRDQQKRPSITTHSPGATTIVYDEEAAPPPSPTDQAEARVMRRSLEANVVLTVAGGRRLRLARGQRHDRQRPGLDLANCICGVRETKR